MKVKVKDKPTAFQFYPSDFLMDEKVMVMTNQQVGIYIKMICFCWQGGSLPNDADKIARMCGEDVESMNEMWGDIVRCFDVIIDPETGESRLVHRRLKKEFKKQQDFRAKMSRAGKLSAEKRWGKKFEDESKSEDESATTDEDHDEKVEKTNSKSDIPKCPYAEIIALYHEELPELPAVNIITANRKRVLAARWREDSSRQTLDWWRDYFRRIKGSNFLMGRSTDFRADFDWIIGPRNFEKIMAGRYDNKTPTNGTSAMQQQIFDHIVTGAVSF